MWLCWLLCLSVLSVDARGSLAGRTFDGPTIDIPEGFLIGAGSAAFQIEGSENADGKGPSVLDGLDTKGAADSYRRYKEDVRAIKDLKLQAYRFSVSWPRVLPDGDSKKPNQAGVDYYNNLINELIDNGIQPMITMLHYDLPLEVRKKTGGWTDRRMVDAFAEYGDFLFENFGDRVIASEHYSTQMTEETLQTETEK
ncbi:beta-glucosidase 7-like [Thrips palmi]|uniref:Beta-glucosidase 7-like n=1 Tax=Thrips palmi TaxID=161013 RepID=A0A6P8YDG4_THRPL|nr:beta-glucosidase 7-like [Thrips palmi]